jgi:hypothetical protein
VWTFLNLQILNKKGKHMVIFEENYGWFVMLSILRYPNFISPLHLIKGLLRKPRLHLTANFCLASLNRLLRKNQRYTCFLILMGNGEPLGRGNFNYQLPFANCRFRAGT